MKTNERKRTVRRAKPERATGVPTPGERRGVILIAVVVCLLVIMLTAGTLARAILLHRREVRDQLQQVQAHWIAESAARRAMLQARLDPNTVPKMWRMTLQRSAGAASGVALFEISGGDDSPPPNPPEPDLQEPSVPEPNLQRPRDQIRRIQVTVHWPHEPEFRATVVREVNLAPHHTLEVERLD